MKFKTTTVMLVLFVAAAWLVSCTDVPSTGPTPPDFTSEFRFANAAQDLGSVGITVDGQSVGTVDFASATQHQEFPSGNRVAVLSTGDSLRVGMTSEHRATVVLLPLTGGERESVTLTERFTYTPASTDTPFVRVLHAAATEEALNVTISGPAELSEELSFRNAPTYHALPVGDYTISVTVAADTTETVIGSTTVSLSNMRHTSIIVGNSTAVQFINLTD